MMRSPDRSEPVDTAPAAPPGARGAPGSRCTGGRWSALLSGLGLGLCAAWFTGRVLNDRTLLTQYVSWVPGEVLPGLGLLASLLAAWLAGRRSKEAAATAKRRSRRGAWLARAAIGVSALSLVAGASAHWRWWSTPGPGPDEQAVRLVHWTMSTPDLFEWREGFARLSPGPKPDVVVLFTVVRAELLKAAALELGEEYRLVRWGSFAAISRFPVEALRVRSLGLVPGAGVVPDGAGASPIAPERERPPSALVWIYNRIAPLLGTGRRSFVMDDPGTIAFLRLDTREALGRATTVWAIDLPSDPLEARAPLARAAARAIRGHARDLGGAGLEALAAPDLIVGDLNIPRGSWSLRGLLPEGFRDAFDDAGRGRAGTWPARFPIWQIDHLFVGPGWRAVRYEQVDTGRGDHRVQVGDLAARRGAR